MADHELEDLDTVVPAWEELGIPVDDNAEPDDADADHPGEPEPDEEQGGEA